MKVEVTRKRDSQFFTGIKSLIISKRGWFPPHINVAVEFGAGASTGYTSKKHKVSWRINPDETPRMGMDFCEKIEVFEEFHSSASKVIE